MELRRANPASVGHADRDREVHRTARPPAVAPDVADQLVEGRIAERVVLHLADRPPACHREPDRASEDPGLRERRIDAAIGAEAILEPRGGAEDPTRSSDVLAEHHDVGIALHLDMEGVVHRFDERPSRHREGPVAVLRTHA